MSSSGTAGGVILMVGLLAFFAILGLVIKSKGRKRDFAKAVTSFEAIDGQPFQIDEYLLGATSSDAIAYDAKRRVLVHFANKDTLSSQKIEAEQILSVGLEIDGVTVAHTQKQGWLGRALIGGAVAGVAGAIIGAGTSKAKTTSDDMVTSMLLKILVDGPSPSACYVALAVPGTKKGTAYFIERKQVADKWMAIIRSMMKHAETSAQKPTTISPAAATAEGSVVEQLVKLADLQARGVLTEPEFQAAKARLLSGGEALTGG